MKTATVALLSIVLGLCIFEGSSQTPSAFGEVVASKLAKTASSGREAESICNKEGRKLAEVNALWYEDDAAMDTSFQKYFKGEHIGSEGYKEKVSSKNGYFWVTTPNIPAGTFACAYANANPKYTLKVTDALLPGSACTADSDPGVLCGDKIPQKPIKKPAPAP